MVDELIEFDIEKVSPSIIMVAGVGGGGSNAVNHMFELGIADVTFMICNTDRQALYRSPVPIKVKLGEHLTEGLGAGNNPERGRAAAQESLDEIISIFKREGTKMVFITAGMGGGTGTGAAPVIAKAARELGILTVGIVTLPFKAEGKIRAKHAQEGIEQLRQHVDSLLIINNENIQEIYGKLALTEAFGKADDILATAAKGIAEIITREGVVNVDFADVKTVMSNSGVALMGSGRASGEGRAQKVADLSLSSPLLNHNYITGAKNILLNITSGHDEITLEETYQITEYIQGKAGNEANIIWGAGYNQALGSDIEVTIIATGFDLDANNAILNRESIGNAFPGPKEPAVREEPVMPEDAETGPKEEQPVQPPVVRKRWTPPVEKEAPNPFKRPHTAAPGGSPQAERPVGFVPPVRENNQIIRVQEDTRYADLDTIINTPAFVRRKVKFTGETSDEGAKPSRVSLKEEASSSGKKPQAEGSLFD